MNLYSVVNAKKKSIIVSNLVVTTLLIIICGAIFASTISELISSSKFYVDPQKGNDSNIGTITAPLRSLNKAIEVVHIRVRQGIRSDKIYLRKGVYRRPSAERVSYLLNLKGTADDFSLISAMPAAPGSPNAVQRKSGKWYEKVIIDDGFIITSRWMRLGKHLKIWKTNPGYSLLEWPNRLVRRARGIAITDKDDSPPTTLFTIGPYMLLQDNEPLLWVDRLDEITGPGMRTYHQKTGMLYVWPFGDRNPNQATFESWTSGPAYRNPPIFDGNLEYAAIEGIEFRLFTRLFAGQLAYQKEEDRVIQRHVRIKDNLFSHGWEHIFVDVIGHNFQGHFKPKWGPLAPHFDDRASWHVLNNVFYHPAREVFQIHGPDHIFEYNEIISHGGPWAGPMAFVSAVNTRNTSNALIRGNYIYGQGDNKWKSGSVFMIEMSSRHQSAKSKDCRYGGQVFENNIFADLTQGTAIFLGRGGCRMQNITIQNNIFKTNRGGAAIRITTPHKNLVIRNNIFYDQRKSIEIRNDRSQIKSFGSTPFGSMPSSIEIRDNIFMKNIEAIDLALQSGRKDDQIIIDGNIFFENKTKPVGVGVLVKDPIFRDPEGLDFHVKTGGPYILDGSIIGPYDDAAYPLSE